MVSAPSKRFPLSASPFAPLRLSQPDETAIVSIADDLLVSTLMDYEMLYLREGGVMNPARWKAVKRFDNLVGYQGRKCRRKRSDVDVDADRCPRLVWRGTLDCSLSDIMYGAINQSDADAQAKAAYVRSNIVDSKVLASIATATPSDPFKGLQVKWMVSASGPGLKRLVRLRDFVFLEATGVTQRFSGERVGYHLIHSISIPSLRPLVEYNIVRGSVSLLHLFRESSSNTVEIYSKASLDLMGNMPSRLVMHAACKTMEALERLPVCSQMKKLAWMLRATSRPAKLSHDYSSCRLCQKDLHGEHCLRSRVMHCRICSASVCSKCCRSKTLRLADPSTGELSSRKVRYCTECIRKATNSSGVQVQIDELTQATWATTFTDTRSTLSLSSSESARDSFRGAEEV
ncbi:hypothetical protein PR003_g24213 [Phytophthora rubi]|uniref:FYVE-type domain-containing protein n=1 Tax=Phytophthora rubi TaxID=129364 RepID=A0A6A4CYM1_9STRA|nr:hypothetical protein PR001_g23039 [Phytophthora rubi]KAE9294623.1 hypothetical protein PR003_g24213 [Phytophthora rubi]